MPQHPLPVTTQAFFLCAGLGTRMQPLTSRLPKPLLPLFQQTFVEFTMEQYSTMGVDRFIINTHHLPEAWDAWYGQGRKGIELVHEPNLLGTGGGLKNILPRIDTASPLLIHNGDIISTIDTGALLRKHRESESLVTMALRSTGELCNVGFDPASGLVTDIRNALGKSAGGYEFASIYCIDPSIIPLIPGTGPVSIIPTLLSLIEKGQVTGIVLDEGTWYNAGNPEIYLRMHRELPFFLPDGAVTLIHESAFIDRTSFADPATVIGRNARIGRNCRLEGCIVWPDIDVPDGTKAANRIFFE